MRAPALARSAALGHLVGREVARVRAVGRSDVARLEHGRT